MNHKHLSNSSGNFTETFPVESGRVWERRCCLWAERAEVGESSLGPVLGVGPRLLAAGWGQVLGIRFTCVNRAA